MMMMILVFDNNIDAPFSGRPALALAPLAARRLAGLEAEHGSQGQPLLIAAG
jgi:hypothetical protein